MNRQLLAIAALLGVLAAACGKVGPPVRIHAEPTAAGNSQTSQKAGASAAEESEEQEQQP